MVGRLILGSGWLVSKVAEDIERPVLVGTPDDTIASTLAGGQVRTRVLDPTDEATLDTLDADVVLVLENRADAALSVARAVRSAIPEAEIVAYGGDNAGPGTSGEALATVADRVLDRGRTVAAQVLASAGESPLPGLLTVLRDIDRLAVITHDNPDPDAIASGVALSQLAAGAGCEAEVCYYGDIGHQENRAFVNVLDLDLRRLDPDADLSAFDGFALVDHARPGVNDQLPSDTDIDIVVDHHPPRRPVEARFVDLRSDVGATSTLLVEYFDRARRAVDTDVATALLFGIHVDTHGFVRGVCPQDFEAAASLVDVANLDALERIESPSVDRGTFDVLAYAIDNHRVEGNVMLGPVGQIQNRDVLPQVADRLLTVEGIDTTLVYGIIDGTVYISARSRADELDLGEAMREAFAQLGTAGGHVDMAGAQLDLEPFGDVESGSVSELVESLIADRFLEVLSAESHQSTDTELDNSYRDELSTTTRRETDDG